VTGLPPGAGAGEIEGWHRLHPLSPLVRAGRHLVTIGILVIVLLVANQRQAGSDLIVDLVIVGPALIGGVVSWLVTRWEVVGGVLRVDTGLIRRESRRFPLSQVQAIDVVQTGLARVLGLAEVRLRMAGADSAGGRLACLRLADAERLRERLLVMTRVTGPVAAASPAPERVLFRVDSGRLAGAIALSRAGALAAIVIAAVACVVALTGQPGTIAPFLPFVLGIVLAVWRQFNGEYGTVVAAAPQGLRLRSGLVQTTAETVRPGRVQAVRLVEPLIWRAFGWCRLEVDVAGPRQRRENRPESQRLRALIPVGPAAQADQMLGELLGTWRRPARRPPRAARWKAPLTCHFLAWDLDDHYAVASRGRLCRKTTWVPLEKVQSIRWVQGPVQRRLGLASVRLDVAGRRVTASIQDRDVTETRVILGRLPDLARDARAARGLCSSRASDSREKAGGCRRP
jgi:putative membrane protein